MFILVFYLTTCALDAQNLQSLLEDLVSLLIVFYEEIELDLSPHEGLAGIDGRQGGKGLVEFVWLRVSWHILMVGRVLSFTPQLGFCSF